MLALRTCLYVLIVKECRIGFIDGILSGLELAHSKRHRLVELSSMTNGDAWQFEPASSRLAFRTPSSNAKKEFDRYRHD